MCNSVNWKWPNYTRQVAKLAMFVTSSACIHAARSSQPPHLVPLVAQLKGSAGRHVMVHVSDAYLCHQSYQRARKEPPHGTRSCAQPRNDSSKVSGL